MEYHLSTPLEKEDIMQLNIADIVYITGTILTARDEAHIRILETEELPFALEGAVIYHCGPLVKEIAENNWQIVAAGPTTSDRMSAMTPKLLQKHNVRALIGKGGMINTADTLKEQCVYLAYTGGCAALAAEKIIRVKTVHWIDLGMPEAVWELEVKGFGPLIVGIDAKGEDLFENVKQKAKKNFSKNYDQLHH